MICTPNTGVRYWGYISEGHAVLFSYDPVRPRSFATSMVYIPDAGLKAIHNEPFAYHHSGQLCLGRISGF